MNKDYGSWTIPNLKNELRKRNAKTGGKKAVLVQRLEDYDKLFGPLITDPESIFKISVPDPQQFRDVMCNSILPALNEEDLGNFCQLSERSNVTTSRNIYEEYFLMSCRIAVAGGDHYVTGMVASEMRRNVIYNVTMKLKNHLILEAQCECAAGMGPYAQCKHVLVVVFAIMDMSNHKKIKLKTSITSNLQTFHQPKKLHTGDPLKAEELTLKFKDDKYKELKMFDPRPITEVESAESYANNFKKIIANFCGHYSQTRSMPIAQLLKPADIPSVYSDHDYLKYTKEEEFLESLRLTEEERSSLEEKTRANKKIWKQERLMRIHSSNFGKICKAKNGKKNIAKSLVKYMNILTKPIRHGLKHEDAAVHQFELKTGLTTVKCGIFVHHEHQFLASTPDRLVGENCVLEVKCPYTAIYKTISPKTVPYLNLCEKTGQIKLDNQHDYYYQVQGQMLCTGRETAYFCIYTINDFKIIKIKRNNSFIDAMLENLSDFNEKYFKDVVINKFLYNKKK